MSSPTKAGAVETRAVDVVIGQPKRLHGTAGIDRGLEHRGIEGPPTLVCGAAPLAVSVRRRPHQVVPSGKATTVWPARSRARDGVHHRGQPPQTGPFDRDDFKLRATIPLATPVNMSARATNEPGNTEPMVKTSNQEICAADHQDPAQVPDRAARHRDPHAQQRSANRQ